MDAVKYYQAPFGWLRLVANEYGICRLDFVDEAGSETTASSKYLEQAIRELDEYFAGTRQRFEVPYNFIGGTEFQQQVWRALAEIPYGQTASYKDIAIAIGNEKAVRAVGGANNKNPIAIIVPCHRVIGKDGKMVGFGGGIATKVWLLDHERGWTIDER